MATTTRSLPDCEWQSAISADPSLYRYGVGKAIGSMDSAVLSSPGEIKCLYGSTALPRPSIITPLQGSAPHAVFYDVTHDNESPAHKRTAEDALSTGALVTFTRAAIGSNKGFDDLYPKLLNLVTDTRMYSVTGPADEQGIGRVKRVLNHLHAEMMMGGYEEGHVHEEGQYIMFHRVHPTTHKGYLLVAHTAFPGFKGRDNSGCLSAWSFAKRSQPLPTRTHQGQVHLRRLDPHT